MKFQLHLFNSWLTCLGSGLFLRAASVSGYAGTNTTATSNNSTLPLNSLCVPSSFHDSLMG